jgi:hypothetical protein
MNSYSLTSDSRRWWWPSATAGAIGTAAVTAILVVPSTGYAIPVDDTRRAPLIGGAVVVDARSAGPARPCFLLQPRWNVALDGHQPTCGETPHGAVQRPAFQPDGRTEHLGVRRPWLEYGP